MVQLSLVFSSPMTLFLWQANVGSADGGEPVLKVVVMVLAGGLFIALCVALLFGALRSIGKHQALIYQELEKLGLERSESPEAAVYEGSLGDASVSVVFGARPGMRTAQVGVFFTQPLEFGLEMTRRPGASWPRGARLTRELFDRHFDVEAEDPEAMSSLLESGKLRLAIARVLDDEAIFKAFIRETHVESLVLITDKADPSVVTRIINQSVAVARLLNAAA